jgi:F-type H+-transporting ATPase subunit b
VTVRFETAPEVLCGIELQTSGRKIAWSLEDYLGALEERLAAALQEETHEHTNADTPAAAAATSHMQKADDDDA